MAAWSRVGRGGTQLSQSLSRVASEAGATPGASSALRNACGSLYRGIPAGPHVSPLHGLAVAGLANRCAGARLLSRGITTTVPRLQPCAAAVATAEPTDGALRLNMPSLGPTKPNEKPRLVVLGTGWAACRLLKEVEEQVRMALLRNRHAQARGTF
jgi:NADH:ubiquinone reductase (non-electrogenic)